LELCNLATEFPACLYDKAAIKRMKSLEMKDLFPALTWMDKKAVHPAGTFVVVHSNIRV